ncbi:serpin family protein [Parvimonas micra]|uniref:serpin family protein n=1 Tax=Parvimonas micra TaxID=33033 RepID=UPI001E448C8E|nr:serpin family protein [Parvimonas micra]MCE3020211.1 serpin family protein [Parvimonas micra]
MKNLLKTILLFFVSISLASCSKAEKPFPENREQIVFNKDKTKNINKLNLEIFSMLKSNKGENFVLSPLSIQRCLDLISLSTEDRENLEFLKNYDDAHLQNLKLKNSKLANLILINTKNFNGETKNLNYDNVKTVKSSKEATKTYQDFQKKHLEEILDKAEFDESLITSFIDTVNYDANWDQKFNESLTKMRDFKKLDGSVIQVKTMSNSFENSVAISDEEKEAFSMVANDSKVYFIKPKKNEYFSAEQLQETIYSLENSNESAEVTFFLPKIDTKTEVDFKSLFSKIGLDKMLSGYKLEKLLGNTEIKVSDAKQNSILKIDENGAKAKTVTKISNKSTAVPGKKHLTIKMDSPFYVIIEDLDEKSNTNLITFSAFITDPSK